MGFKHNIYMNGDYSEWSLARMARISYYPAKAIDEYGLGVWLVNLQEIVNIVEGARERGRRCIFTARAGRVVHPRLRWRSWSRRIGLSKQQLIL
jgi:hypothetical protein